MWWRSNWKESLGFSCAVTYMKFHFYFTWNSSKHTGLLWELATLWNLTLPLYMLVFFYLETTFYIFILQQLRCFFIRKPHFIYLLYSLKFNCKYAYIFLKLHFKNSFSLTTSISLHPISMEAASSVTHWLTR